MYHWSAARLAVTSFLGTLWLCLAATWLGWGQFNPANERRALAPWPRADITFAEGFGLYLRDHFGFRGWLVSLNALLRAKLLHTSTSPEVMMGSEGFLFFMGEGALQSFTGVRPMTGGEVNKWVALFERRASWLRERNIPFVVVVAPNKETIYPEMVPASVRRGTARMNTLIEALRPRMTVVDLRQALVEHKRENLLYYRTDTHWTQWGAYWAYRSILPSLQSSAPIRPADLKLGNSLETLDLTRMLGLGSIDSEFIETLAPPEPSPIVGTQGGNSIRAAGPAGKPRLVFFRDSFGAALIPFLAVHFSSIYAPNGWTFEANAVLTERPALVLLEIVERRLNDVPPIDPVYPPSLP